MLAQNVHRKGLFNGVAVFFTLAGLPQEPVRR
jgi:hypothetical protein